jgi:hypothetical protein
MSQSGSSSLSRVTDTASSDDLDYLLRVQREAVAAGIEAQKAGRGVIYIHGRPYVDPGDESFN